MIVFIGYHKHPHEVALLLVCLLSGVAGLFTSGSSSNVLGQLPSLWLYSWHTVLVVGSTLALVGIFLHGMVGHLLERAGLLALLAELLGYGAVLFGLVGLRASFFALMCIGVAAANFVRIRQINRDLKQVRAEDVELEE